MKTVITLLFLFICSACFAQKQYIYLVNADGKLVTTRDSTDLIYEVNEPDSGTVLYNVIGFYKSGKRELVGKTSTIYYPFKYENTVISFFENGKRKAINNYKNGDFINDQYEYYPNGKLYSVKRYDDKPSFLEVGQFLLLPSEKKQFSYFTNFDSLGTALVTDGNGYYKGYNPSFTQVSEEGNIKNGFKDGEWKGVEDKIDFTEVYKNGKFLSGKSTNELGEITNYTERRTLAQFPGGPNAFTSFLGRTIRYPSYERERNIQGKVILQFYVEKDGTVTNIRSIRHPSEALAEESIRVLSLSPKWVAATKLGNTIRSLYTVPINFQLGEEK